MARLSPVRPGVGILCALAVAGCMQSGDTTPGNLQPQSVTGPCQVEKFYLVPLTRSYARISVVNTGQACRLTMINPALQFVQSSALVTEPPARGQAGAELINGGQSIAVTFVPGAGYSGSDAFTVTVEPNAKTITFRVAIQPPRP